MYRVLHRIGSFFSNRYFWRKNVIVRVKRLSLEEFYKKCHDVVMWAFFLLSLWNWPKFLTEKIGTFQAKMTKNGPKMSEKNTIYATMILDKKKI